MNKVILIGNLTKDVEVSSTTGGISVAKFNLAVQRTYANADGEKEADFIGIVAWRKLAELCSQYLTKGSKVAIEGKLQTRNYEASDGTKRYVTEVVAEEIQFLTLKNNNESNTVENKEKPKQAKMEPIDDDGLPF